MDGGGAVASGRTGAKPGRGRFSAHVRPLVLVLALALSALLLRPVPAVAAEARVAIRAAVHPDHARIVFDWPMRVTFTATLQGERVQIHFPRPFEADLGLIASRLKGYVVRAERDASGQDVTLILARPLALHQMVVSGHLAVIDLKPTARPRAARSEQAPAPAPKKQVAAVKPVEPEKPAPVPSSVPSPARTLAPRPGTIAVTAEPLAQESRIVFHLPHRRTFTLHQVGTRLVLGFKEPLTFDFDGLSPPPPGVIGATQSRHGRGTLVTMRLASDAHVRFSREGPEIVVGVPLTPAVRAAWKQALARAAAAATPKTAASAPASSPVPLARPVPEAPAASPEVATAAAKPAAKEEPAVKGQKAMLGRETPAHPLPAVPVEPVHVASLSAVPLAPGEVEKVVIGTSPLSPGLRLTFPWREKVEAAAYERAGRLWLVFDRPAKIDAAALGESGAAGEVRDLRTLTVAGASVLSLALKPGLAPSVSRDGSEWVVDLKPATAAPLPRPIDVRSEPNEKTGPRVFLPVMGLGREVDFTDPEVGDRVRVVPLADDGFGIALRHDYPQFALLPSAQGIVIVQKGDGLLLQPLQNGLQIAAAGGLLLSAAPGQGAASPWLFHIADWRGEPGQFNRDEGRLLLAVALAAPGARTAARRDLARFYFANRFDTEAEAVLTRLANRNPAAGQGPQFRSLRGAVLVGMRHYAEAAKALGGADLAFDPQAALWRGLIAAQRRHWKEAIRELGTGAKVLDAYPPDWRGQFLLAGAEAAIATGDRAGAQATLAALGGVKLSPDERAEATLLSGRLAGLMGKKSKAAALYTRVAASRALPEAAKARLDLINTGLALHRISEAEAIDRLERLRFDWRGDATELAVDQRLGQLYIATGKPHQGLEAWRRAIRDFPDSPLAPKLASASAAEFRKLFLDGGAKQLPPIEALAVYYDFRKLTPQGSDGDAMIRNLADRLVALDLLDRAADLLNYQVTHRLSGAEKARVGARLALVQLLNDKPDAAIAALNESAMTPLAAPLALERRDLMARAEADQGKTDAALALIKGDTSLVAEKLRADINWRAKRWKAAAASLWILLGKSDTSPAPLDAAERQKVMQLAVALSLGDDEKGLAELRQRFGKRLDGTPEANGFRVITQATDHGDSDYRQLTRAIANVKQLESFMSSYRARLEKGKLSAID